MQRKLWRTDLNGDSPIPICDGAEGRRFLGAATISSSSHRLVLSPELAADQEFIARFRREARALSEINHPNISSAAQPRSHRGRADRGGVLVCDVLPTIASTFPE